MSFRRLLAPALAGMLSALPAGAQQNIDSGEGGPFLFTDNGVLYEQLLDWAYYFSPTFRVFSAAVDAIETSDSLERGMLEVECFDTFAGRVVEIHVTYIPLGGLYPDDAYSLDLFNSVASGRPAAFNLGAGFIRTDHIAFNRDAGERIPNEYYDLSEFFWQGLQPLGPTDEVEIRFRDTNLEENYVSLMFPMTGFSDVLAAAGDYCP